MQARFPGEEDASLTETGRAQIAAAAARLTRRQVSAIVTSPAARAVESAQIAASILGVEPRIDSDLRETHFGAWGGCTFAEVQQAWPHDLDSWLADTAVAPPAGESFADTAVRVRRALERTRDSHAGDVVLVVSHVTPIKTIILTALGAPLSALPRMQIDLASLSQVRWFADGPSLVDSVNDTRQAPE